MSPSSFYQQKIDTCNTRLTTIRQQIGWVALLRGTLFIGLITAIYFLSQSFSLPGLLGCGVLAGLFITAINFHFHLRDRRFLWEKLHFVNTNELEGLAGAKNQFPDGLVFLDSDNYLDDLDIFGPTSLFHYLNRTTTSHGTAALTGWLRQAPPSRLEIGQRQEAIRVLAGQPEIRQLLTARGLLAPEKEGNLHSIGDWLSSPSRLYGNKAIQAGIWLLTIYNLGALLWYLDSNNYHPLLVGVILSWLLVGRFSKYTAQQHDLLGRKQAVLDQYAAILEEFNKVEPGSALLLQTLQGHTGKAYAAIRRLSKLTSFFDQRSNVLVNIFLNSFLVYDLRCGMALEKWKETNKSVFKEWIDAVGKIECLNSFGSYAFNNPGYCWPVPVEEETTPSPAAGGGETALFVEARQLAHPLIPAGSRVANDFAIGSAEHLILVTGSNMSGKTTFLRTVGVNLLLAQCGAPVCATAFRFTPLQLLTSLRISDSLQEQTSYFMAELKKLQKIIHRLRTGAPSLVLIDEILRGTNSEDKTYGSELFIRQLLQYHCLSLFATHDLSLGDLEQEKPGEVGNYCFESIIEADILHFDYRLQRGIARNRNASFLMKKMDII